MPLDKAPTVSKTVFLPAADQTQAEAAEAAQQQRRALVPLSALTASKLNPRTHFDDEKIAGLAESIAAEGVLQNLTVRPAGEKDVYEIVAGESRFRALQKLATAKRIPADYPVPVLVRAVSDVQLLELALAENLARNALTPMEEARAYARLRKAGVGTAKIAAAVGVTQRLIQQRLNLVDRLAPAAQQALEAGELKVEQARELVKAPKPLQEKLAKELVRRERAGEELTSEDLSRALLRDAIPVKKAMFDPALYTGEYIVDDDTGERWFADRKQVEKLTDAAIETKTKELKAKGRAFVNVVMGYFSDYGWHRDPKNPQAGAVIEVDRHHCTFKVHDHMVKGAPTGKSAGDATRPAPDSGAKPEDAFTRGHREHAQLRRSHALQEAVMGDVTLALRLACIGLLGAGGDTVDIRRRGHHGYNAVRHLTGQSPRLLDALRKDLDGLPKDDHAEMFDDGAPATKDRPAVAPSFQPNGFHDDDAIWAWVMSLPGAKVPVLFARLVAAAVVDAEEVPLAALLTRASVKLPRLAVIPADLDGLRKPALLAIARAGGVLVEESWTAARIRAQLADAAGADPAPSKVGGKNDAKRSGGLLKAIDLPSLQWLDPAARDKALAAFVKSPATKPASKPASKPAAKAKPKGAAARRKPAAKKKPAKKK